MKIEISDEKRRLLGQAVGVLLSTGVVFMNENARYFTPLFLLLFGVAMGLSSVCTDKFYGRLVRQPSKGKFFLFAGGCYLLWCGGLFFLLMLGG